MKRTVWLWAPRAKMLAPAREGRLAQRRDRTTMPAALRLPRPGGLEGLVEGDAGVVGGHPRGADLRRLPRDGRLARPVAAPRRRLSCRDTSVDLHVLPGPQRLVVAGRDGQAEGQLAVLDALRAARRWSPAPGPPPRAPRRPACSTSASPSGPASVAHDAQPARAGAAEGRAEGHDDDERQEEDEEEVGAVAHDAQQVDAGDLEGGHQRSTSRRTRRQAQPARHEADEQQHGRPGRPRRRRRRRWRRR